MMAELADNTPVYNLLQRIKYSQTKRNILFFALAVGKKKNGNFIVSSSKLHIVLDKPIR